MRVKMVGRKRKSGAGFYERYQPADRFLLKPATGVGRPGMIEAVSPNGDAVLIREWPRRTKDDDDLVDIWRHELRQLHRLGGYPGAQRYIARLVDADRDAKGFYIVLDAGQRRPLEVLLQRGRGGADWLRALNIPANRHRLWSNLQRVAFGLEILHNEGLVHRNLDGWSVLTSAGDDPDFQLTGFEWSLRLTSTGDKPTRGRAPQPPSVSFAADWAAFARLAGRVLNITEGRLLDRATPDYEVHESASALEIRLLRELLSPGDSVRLDGGLVSSKIEQVLQALSAERAAEDGRYHLGLRLSRDSGLSASIREASGLAIEVDDVEGQRAWVTSDIGATAHLMIVGDGDGAQIHLRGRDLVYRLKKHAAGPADPGSWQFAFCEQAEPVITWRRRVAGSAEAPATSLKLLTHVEARQSWPRLRSRTPSWARWIEAVATITPALTRESRIHRAATLLHALQVAYASASAFSVRVRPSDAPDRIELEYLPRSDADELAQALGLEPPSSRLRESLEAENFGEAEGWVLSEAARLGQAQAGDVELAFEETVTSSQGLRYRFRLASSVPVLFDQGYLVPAGARGDFVQFRRRSKALRKLKDHAELLQVLADPRRRLVPTHDVVTDDDAYKRLDPAKQQALHELSAVLPLYLLQGPPGVGKTYLVKDVVQRRFHDERSSRLLITSQGNHAVDHLLDELSADWRAAPETEPLAVRCRPKEDRTAGGPYDLRAATDRLARGLAGTLLAQAARPGLQRKLEALAGAAPTSDNAALAGERRSLEGLLMRSANLVFATTNSADLERLLDERGQFDWAVVEEAGKATGGELITPLMLSHRRLMIGDHKQLPPFGSRELETLLDQEQAVRTTLQTLARLLNPAVRNLLDEDLLEFIEDEAQDLAPLCTEAKRILYLFETLLQAELDRRRVRPGPFPVASTLSVQHRMHPVLCELVSKTFYQGDLTTSDKRTARAALEEGTIVSTDKGLADKPLGFVDMPYERSAPGGGRVEALPRFTNPSEVAEMVRQVAGLSVAPGLEKPPSLVILSPYARQVRRLREAVLGDPAAAAALASFRTSARGGEWVSTVDAFQGNEADVVLFSLVRNNRGATLTHALGFVGDERRFNVLLSRARQRLIFVGSLEFLRTVARPMGNEEDPASAFLRRLMDNIDDQIERKVAGRCVGGDRVAA